MVHLLKCVTNNCKDRKICCRGAMKENYGGQHQHLKYLIDTCIC